jgi:hypothetical protein
MVEEISMWKNIIQVLAVPYIDRVSQLESCSFPYKSVKALAS